MTLKDFSFLCDENIDREVIDFLLSESLQAFSVDAVNLSKTSDELILKHAFKNNLVILTHDSDFGKIIYSQKVDFIGIVYLRPGHFKPSFTIHSLKTILHYPLNFAPPFIAVVEQKDDIVKVRLRNNL